MRRAHLLIPIALGALAALLVGTMEPPDAERLVAGVARGAETARPAGSAAASPAGATQTAPRPARSAAAAPTDEPEALAAWFQEEVMRELESGSSAGPWARGRTALSGPAVRRTVRLASARVARPADAENAGLNRSGGSDRHIDWAYLQGVFDGRISGIPNEAKAGVSLQEIDELGDIPYIEQLREDGRYEELRELGFENETVPWPSCLRTATCRRDRASSPP
jgi:hypothetical protein